MRIPHDATIARNKLTHYLLVPRQRNDKSGFLAQAGFTQANPDLLEQAIRHLIREQEAVSDREDEYGRFYRVEGALIGPTSSLDTITIWIETVHGEYRFVTLKPARNVP